MLFDEARNRRKRRHSYYYFASTYKQIKYIIWVTKKDTDRKVLGVAPVGWDGWMWPASLGVVAVFGGYRRVLGLA